MRVLFIYKNESFMAPIGLCSISAVARQMGWLTYLSEMNTGDPVQAVREIGPDVVAYSSCTGEAKHYLKVNRIIKQEFPNVLTIMGGPHPTFFPEMLEDSTLDAICIGEGEWSFDTLLRNYPLNGTRPAGIVVKGDNDITIAPLVEDLDWLPFPDYSLFYNNLPTMGQNLLKSFITSRGCPYNCTYCFNHAWKQLYSGKGKLVRRHSVDYVLEDIKRVRARWPLGFIKFYDDIFVYKSDTWLEKFSRRYKKEIGLPFFILTRADLITDDIVMLLEYAGCQTISMSIEAGNDGIRNDMLKRSMTKEQIINAHRICEKYGIKTFTNCIIGLPGTDIHNDVESLELCVQSKVDWAEFPIFYPYPKTELGDQTIAMGLYAPEYGKMHTSYQSFSPLNFDKKHKLTLKNFSILGPVASVFPRLRGIITNYLIYWPFSRLFTFLYYLVKMWVMRTKIYPSQVKMKTSVEILLRSLRQEFFRHNNTDKEIAK